MAHPVPLTPTQQLIAELDSILASKATVWPQLEAKGIDVKTLTTTETRLINLKKELEWLQDTYTSATPPFSPELLEEYFVRQALAQREVAQITNQVNSPSLSTVTISTTLSSSNLPPIPYEKIPAVLKASISGDKLGQTLAEWKKRGSCPKEREAITQSYNRRKQLVAIAQEPGFMEKFALMDLELRTSQITQSMVASLPP